MDFTIALFGESQKGDFRKAYYCKTLVQLSEHLGEPPHSECRGLHFAIQALLYDYKVIFFRVHEEGFSTNDYLRGLQFLEAKKQIEELTAICMPGVGNGEIIEATSPICQARKTFLIVTERDLYDYLTYRNYS